MSKISAKNILLQLKADLIGKDSYRGVTLTYSWLANQFGHFSLGFIPATILFFRLKKYYSIEDAGFRADGFESFRQQWLSRLRDADATPPLGNTVSRHC